MDAKRQALILELDKQGLTRSKIAISVGVGQATVYRVLTQFEQAGLVQKHFFEPGKAVFELNEGKHHDHLVCMQCGKVEEFYDPEIEKRQIKVAQDRGFVITEHALHLSANCVRPHCPNKKAAGH